MRTLKITIGVSMISTLLMAFANVTARKLKVQPITELKAKPIELIEVCLEPEMMTLELKNHYAFLDAVGHRESSGNYKAVNRYGYLGKYQFGRSTLNHIKIEATDEEFLNSPKLQEEAMHRLLLANKKSLRKYIRKYNNKTVHGVYITESGLLAAAHLGGAGSVRKFLKKGYQFKDGNGTKLTSYIEQFAGYTLTLNE